MWWHQWRQRSDRNNIGRTRNCLMMIDPFFRRKFWHCVTKCYVTYCFALVRMSSCKVQTHPTTSTNHWTHSLIWHILNILEIMDVSLEDLQCSLWPNSTRWVNYQLQHNYQHFLHLPPVLLAKVGKLEVNMRWCQQCSAVITASSLVQLSYNDNF